MNVREIIKKALIEIGAAGLCNDDKDCGCDLDDLMPCDSPSANWCEAAKVGRIVDSVEMMVPIDYKKEEEL